MNKIFNSINMHNIDSNTKKQIEEPGWRVAAGEEEKIFLEYYLSGKKVNRINNAIRNILVVALLYQSELRVLNWHLKLMLRMTLCHLL